MQSKNFRDSQVTKQTSGRRSKEEASVHSSRFQVQHCSKKKANSRRASCVIDHSVPAGEGDITISLQMGKENGINVIEDHAIPGMTFGLSSLQVEEFTCNSRAGNYQKPKCTLPSTSYKRLEVALSRTGIRTRAGGPAAQFTVIPGPMNELPCSFKDTPAVALYPELWRDLQICLGFPISEWLPISKPLTHCVSTTRTPGFNQRGDPRS
jgi:hypothetical protein